MSERVGVLRGWRPRTRSGARSLWRWARSVPFTWIIALIAVLTAVGRLTMGIEARRSFDAIISSGFDSVMVEHHWLAAATSIFFVHGPLELLAIVALLGLSERLLGTKRTAVVYAVVALLGTGLGIGIQALGIQAGDAWSQTVRSHGVIDALLPIGGTLMAASAFATPLLRRRIRVLGFAILLMFVLYSGQPADLYRLLAAAVGLGFGRLLAGRPWRTRVPHSSHREARSLLGALVAITAIGPVITITSPVSFGPLKPLGLLFKVGLDQDSYTILNCELGNASKRCIEAAALARLDGIGPVLLTLLPLVALLVAAYGIIRGRRIGLWLAVSINVLLSFLAAAYYGIFPRVITGQFYVHAGGGVNERDVLILVAVLVPLVTAILLVMNRHLFPTDFRGDGAGRFFVRVGLTLVSLSALYLSIAWLVRDQFTPAVTFLDLLLDLPERFIPVGFLAYERIDIDPQGMGALIPYLWLGPVFWTIVVVLAAAGIQRGRLGRDTADSTRLLTILKSGAGGSMSWMATWPGHHYWFSADGRMAVAYRVISGIALATGEPLGPGSRKAEAIWRFAEFCTNHGWTPAFYSVGDGVRPALESLHWSTLPVAEETVLRPLEWSIEGKKMQDVRTSVNRATRSGIRAKWTRFAALTPNQVAQIRDISEAWVSEKDLPELGFTLGGFDELTDPEVALMLAIDEAGRVQAVTSWLPTFVDGDVVGWTLDFMRRREDAMPGVMEFIISQSVLRAREAGVEFMSLSGAPLANSENPPDSAVEHLLAFLGRALEPVYGFSSLLRFKKKFRPELRPLYLAYPDPLALPAIAVCIARAYAPQMSSAKAFSLLR